MNNINSIYVHIKNFRDVEKINAFARDPEVTSNIFLEDHNGSKANAASLLGMMSLDFYQPVKISCDSNKYYNKGNFVDTEVILKAIKLAIDF